MSGSRARQGVTLDWRNLRQRIVDTYFSLAPSAPLIVHYAMSSSSENIQEFRYIARFDSHKMKSFVDILNDFQTFDRRGKVSMSSTWSTNQVIVASETRLRMVQKLTAFGDLKSDPQNKYR